VLHLVLVLFVTADEPSCPAGQSRTADTQGHCCWPAQAWSTTQQLCVGVPQCPPGTQAEGQGCTSACPEGQSIGPDTQGHCCWPAQAWSQGRATCVGLPQCAAGFTAQGEQCVKGPPAPAAAVTVPAATAAGSSDDDKPPPGMHVERHFRVGLIAGGAAAFGVGWLLAIAVSVGGGAYAAAKPKNTCWASVSEIGWVPFIGPALAIGGLSNPALHDEGGTQCQKDALIYAPGVAVAAISTIAQFAGAAMMVLGFTLRTHELVPDEPHASRDDGDGGPLLGVHLGAAGSPLGLSFTVTRF